jgi:cobalt-zinc-cadmium efflux system membrane fusion protein
VARQEELVRAGVGAQRNLIDAQGELRTAQAELRSAGERTRLYGGGGASGTIIRAPLDGEVLERHATVGEMVHNDEPLFLIGDLSNVWIMAHVYEQDVAVARMALPARLTLDAYPGRSWEGNLTYVASRLDPETRTLEVRLELPNDGTLRPGLFGTLWLPPAGTDPSRAVLAVPESAVQRLEGGEAVFVETAPNRFEPRPVQLGARGAGFVEVRGGIVEGARIAVAGTFVLKSELMKGEVGGHDH